MVLRILHVLPSLDIGGVETSTLRLSLIQKELGFHPLVVSAGGPLVASLKAHNIDHITLALDTKNPIQILRHARILKKLQDQRRLDIVHVHSRAPAWSVYYAFKDTGLPWVSTFHGVYSHQNRLKRKYNEVMLKGDGVIAPSHYIKKHIESTYPRYPRIEVIYPGIDLNYFSSAHFSAYEIERKRQSWGIYPGQKALLLPGRLSRIKGHHVAIEALKYLQDSRFKLIIMGQGERSYRTELRDRSLPFKDQVVFVPPENDVRLAYLASDVVLSTSTKPESFGLTILEAQALHKPVIATDLGAPQEIVQDGVSGRIIPAHNPDLLAQAILETTRKPFKIDPHHMEKFCQKVCAQKMLSFYKAITEI